MRLAGTRRTAGVHPLFQAFRLYKEVNELALAAEGWTPVLRNVAWRGWRWRALKGPGRDRARGRHHGRRRKSSPAPEDVFIAWLLALPDGADIAAAARREVARMNAAGRTRPGPARLKQFFVEAATAPRRRAEI